MAIHEIVRMGDPVLRAPAAEVDVFDAALAALVRDMFETMYAAEGVGLAAPQIGISKRILVVDVRERAGQGSAGGRVVLVNPVVVRASARTERVTEGCLSIPGLEEVVERPWSVEVRARDVDGSAVHLEADDLLARALQHEIDHLDGILFLDRVSPLKRKMLLAKWKKLQAEAESEAVGPR